jgi:hypothetical protein
MRESNRTHARRTVEAGMASTNGRARMIGMLRAEWGIGSLNLLDRGGGAFGTLLRAIWTKELRQEPIVIDKGVHTGERASSTITIHSTLVTGPEVQDTTLVEGLGAATEVESSLTMLATVATFITDVVLATTSRLLNGYRGVLVMRTGFRGVIATY